MSLPRVPQKKKLPKLPGSAKVSGRSVLTSSPHPRPISAAVEYVFTGEVIRRYRTLRGARTAATRFNQNAGRKSYRAEICETDR